MIQLHPDYLLIETSPGKIIPCSGELIAVELIGEGTDTLDPELVQQAAAAVLHYFRQDLGRTTVTVGEFSKALEQALLSVGLHPAAAGAANEIVSCDLRKLAVLSERTFELSFFPKLRDAFRAKRGAPAKVLRFYGLRGCVKQLVGARRWSPRCQVLNDQIVEYLRACLETEPASSSCDLEIR